MRTRRPFVKEMITLLFSLALFAGFQPLFAQPIPTPMSTPKAKSIGKAKVTKDDSELSYEQQKKKLELERLDLENEKLKLEMERVKLQGKSRDETAKVDEKKELKILTQQATEKAETLAKKNKKKANLLVMDFVNSEFWYKGIRYNVHDIYSMADDLKIPVKKRLDKRDFGGDPRFKYFIQNMSLLRYTQRNRGILTVKAPAGEGEFDFFSIEGVSFKSNIGDVRNAYQNAYYKYNGEGDRDKYKVLKYVHSRDLDFADKLEFAFDKEGKLMEFRYGVLDEN